MKIFEKVQEGEDWFLKVAVTDANLNRLESFTKFQDEASIDTFLEETSSKLSIQKTSLDARVLELTAEIAAITTLLKSK